MTGSELLSALRTSVLDDVEEPQLWSNAELFFFLSQAQEEFCRRTYCLLDNTTLAVTHVDILAATSTYEINSYILKIKNARLTLGTNVYDLTIIDEQDFEGLCLTSPSVLMTGTPKYLVDNGMFMSSVVIAPIPEVSGTLSLKVTRLPLLDISSDNDPELPRVYHGDLLHGAAYRAYRKQDAETMNNQQTTTHLQLWEEAIERASFDMARRRQVPRTIAPLKAFL